MNAVSKVTVSCILAILLVVISSGSNRMIQVNAQCPVGKVCGQIEEVPIGLIAPGCRHLQANMANDTADHWHAMMFKTLDCADVLARIH
jgi:hypothetical protein